MRAGRIDGIGVTMHGHDDGGISFHGAMCTLARNRSSLTRCDALSGATSNTTVQSQRNHRNQGALRHLQLPGHGDGRSKHGKTTGSLTTSGVVSSDQDLSGTKSSVDVSGDERESASRRSQAHRRNGGQDSESKVGVVVDVIQFQAI